MRLGVSLPVQEGLTVPQYVQLAALAENCGYESIFVGEIASVDALSLVSLIASRTSSARIATGVVSIYTRSPVLAAMGFATADSIANGRIVAGLGTGSRVVVEDWHGSHLRAPRETMADYIVMLRAALSGGRVDMATRQLRAHDFRLQMPKPSTVPVYMGSFNPAMLRLAGAIADGVILAFCPVWGLPERIAQVRRGALEAGRDPAEVQIVAYVNAYAGTSLDQATERFRRLVLQYAVQPTHRAGFVDVFPEIAKATEFWLRGERVKALSLVPDEAIHELCPIGSAYDVIERLEEVRASGVDVPVLFPQSLRPGDYETPMQTIQSVGDALSNKLLQGSRDEGK